MAKRLNPPIVHKTTFTNLEAKKFSTRGYRRPKYILFLNIKQQAIFLYYLILAVCILAFAFIIDQTHIARNIMDASRARITQKYFQEQNVPNQGKIVFTSSYDLKVTITNSQNQSIGEAPDGVRLMNLPGGTINDVSISKFTSILTNKPLSAREITIQPASGGTYNFELTAQKPGKYPISIELTDKTGQRSTKQVHDIVIESKEYQRYLLDYNNTYPNESRWTFKNNFSR